MRLYVTRSDLRKEVYIRSGNVTSASQTVQLEERVNYLLNYWQRHLAKKHQWPWLTLNIELNVAANSNTAPIFGDPQFSKINEVWHIDSGHYRQLEYGITPQDYELYPSSARARPFRKWEVRPPGDEYLYLWPTSNQAEKLFLIIEEEMQPMNSDSDTCSFDGDILVLMAASDLLLKSDANAAQVLRAQAESLLRSELDRQIGRKMPTLNLAHPRSEGPVPYLDFIPPGQG